MPKKPFFGARKRHYRPRGLNEKPPAPPVVEHQCHQEEEENGIQQTRESIQDDQEMQER